MSAAEHQHPHWQITTSIRLKREDLAAMDRRWSALGFKTRAAYIRSLILADLPGELVES